MYPNKAAQSIGYPPVTAAVPYEYINKAFEELNEKNPHRHTRTPAAGSSCPRAKEEGIKSNFFTVAVGQEPQVATREDPQGAGGNEENDSADELQWESHRQQTQPAE